MTGYIDSPHTVSHYLLIHSKAVKAIIKAKRQNLLFYDPSLTHKGNFGENFTSYTDSPHKVSQYLLLNFKAVKAITKVI